MAKTVFTLSRFFRLSVLFLLIWLTSGLHVLAQEIDTDGDGLSDFHETHKYLTDPAKPDSDDDGRPDGDWLERREFQYTIRSVVQVVKPVTPEYLNDDFQDVRVLDETEEYVELEVIHYPFNTIASAIQADENWKQTIGGQVGLQKWLQPGPSSNFSPQLQKQIKSDLATDDIDVEDLNDKQTVTQVSAWLLNRAKYHNGFSTFITAFDDDGQPFIPAELAHAPDRDSPFSVEEQWDREILATGMYENKTRGSCTSSAIYLNAFLRAVDVPTRIVLCIPVVDANDDRELEMLDQIENEAVQYHLKASLSKLKGSWASHTFNEVYVGGRWRRLNYSNLGQGIYDANLFGLITHVATFHDWADAKMHTTIGRRNKLQLRNVSGTANPYSTIALRDQSGIHCSLKLPSLDLGPVNIKSVKWTDSPELEKGIRENCKERGRFGLIAEVDGFKQRGDIPMFLAAADLRVFLNPKQDAVDADQHQRLGIGFDSGCYWVNDKTLRIYLPFGSGDKKNLVNGIDYQVEPRNDHPKLKWKANDLVIKRGG